MEKATVFGLVIGLGGILLGNLFEGGHFSALMQGTAALIVFSGTLGAVMVSSRSEDFSEALRLAKAAFRDQRGARGPLMARVLDLSRKAKKENILALESEIGKINDDFTKDVMRAVVDGVEPKVISEVFETRMAAEEQKLMAAAKVWSDAGGFAPTIGIIGAVLGLIHVMSNLTDTSKLGSGIAVAFVATIYGVGFANLLFLPLGNKVKRIIQDEMKSREMVLHAGLGIRAELSPSVIEMKLKSFLD